MSNAVVAVYGSLRQGMGNHRLLENAEFLCRTVTSEPYAMYSLGGFPKVALNGEKMAPIVVELYSCDEATMARLDRLEGYYGEGQRNFYDRSTIQTECGKDALIYHIEGAASNPVESGDWVQYRTANR
uniref:Gamma-glutamyl cyclotransferase n=3 Tax=unclassified bacterial viruses TaxID=12333 RepID=A0AAU6VZP5_9VIRU